jgi:hypothetical protein
VRPREVFVVGGVVCEASVEDPDEPVRQCPQRLAVAGTVCAFLVVERSGSGARSDRDERLLVARISKSKVAGVARQHDVAATGCLGHR